jgi:hypothetical protein
MGKNIQRYWLEFASRARKEVSVENKHAAFFEGLRNLPEPWGLGSLPIPPVPRFKGGSLAVLSLKKLLGDAVSKSHVMYEYRRDFPDNGKSDDRLNIILRPSKVDVKYLVYTVLPAYIKAFDAYRVECSDEQFVDLEAMRPRPDRRFGVHRFGSVSFFDDLLCQRAFGLRATAVVDLFSGTIGHAAVLHNGAYLVGSSQVLSFEESQRLSHEMQQHLLANQRP